MDHLSGMRVWLSGSVPNDGSPQAQQHVSDFVAAFAAAVFKAGGEIIHGSHPSLVPTLRKAAADYQHAAGRPAGLTLAISRFFSANPAKYKVDLPAWRAEARVVEIPAVADGSGEEEDRSVTRLRDWLAGRCDAVVVAGGQWWQQAPHRAGLPDEISLALRSGLPVFVAAGLGGAAQGFLQEHPEILRHMHNGLDEPTNADLAALADNCKLVERIIAQVARLPLVPRADARDAPFRILALDGGGLRGSYTAAVLARLEQLIGRVVIDHFDLIAGTSTGGILAIGLGLGLPPRAILDLYTTKGATIFPMTTRLQRLRRWFRQWFRSKFAASPLKEALAAVYGENAIFGQSHCRLVVPSYNVTADLLQNFRTPLRADPNSAEWNQSAVDAALATAAAPTYFDPATTAGGIADFQGVDGGVWANCPAGVALAEAVGRLHVPLTSIHMLSVGTTYSPGLTGRVRFQGKAGWAANIATFLLKAQAQATVDQAQRLLGERFLRIDRATTGAELDDVRALPELATLGVADAEANQTAVAERFLNGVGTVSWKL